MKLAMGCDPAAYRFYQKLLERMRDEGTILLTSDESEQEADGGKYAEIAEIVSNKVVNRECDYGILFAEPVREWQWQLTRFQEFVQCFVTMYFRRFLARMIIMEMFCVRAHGLWRRKELISQWQ